MPRFLELELEEQLRSLSSCRWCDFSSSCSLLSSSKRPQLLRPCPSLNPNVPIDSIAAVQPSSIFSVGGRPPELSTAASKTRGRSASVSISYTEHAENSRVFLFSSFGNSEILKLQWSVRLCHRSCSVSLTLNRVCAELRFPCAAMRPMKLVLHPVENLQPQQQRMITLRSAIRSSDEKENARVPPWLLLQCTPLVYEAWGNQKCRGMSLIAGAWIMQVYIYRGTDRLWSRAEENLV
jgi:hypothetical protein